ncbi:MAG: hypothetical protein F4Y71_04535 [Acidobacteria bacterium]|nr:hypothetical protein [Gammaproteobacteria bacterium]MXX85703.1 hypothetical protein [Acidobacteriota bacterium]
MPSTATASLSPPSSRRKPAASAFELRVLPRDRLAYGVALYRLDAARGDSGAAGELVIRVWGDPLSGILDQVLAAIRRAGYRSTDLGAKRRAPFRVAEEDAVRLGLLFAALKPLRKHRRIEEVARAVASMEPEEAHYWFSKVTTGPEQGRVRRALRIMVSDE